MQTSEILDILLTKTINKHYAKRYIRFIEHCLNQVTPTGYTERHHILPRGKTMFPQYKSIPKNPWNCVVLTPKQHFIAHWMLWKACGKYMVYAFLVMKRRSKIMDSRYFVVTSKVYAAAREHMASTQSNRIVSDSTRTKLSKRMLSAERVTCPHCGKTGDKLNMAKYHFDNCKMITGNDKHDVKQMTDIVTCPHCNKTGKKQGMLATHFDQCPVIRGDFRKVKTTATCPHCNKTAKDTFGFRSYHFDNCKMLTGITITKVEYDKTLVTCPHCNKVGMRHGMMSRHFENCSSLKPPVEKITCPHCGKTGNDNGYFRCHHFDKCKMKK